ncbi:MAG: hypothetical protein WC091_19055 [Sulfuricellaceae bacterium]
MFSGKCRLDKREPHPPFYADSVDAAHAYPPYDLPEIHECLAIQEVEKGKWLVVVYREQGSDGFVITAFLTRRIRSLDGRKQLWP